MNPHRLAVCVSRLTAVNSLPREPCSSRLVEFVHVGPLQVLNELQFEILRVGEFALRCAILRAPATSSNAPASRRQGMDENWLESAVLPNVGSLMFRIKLCDDGGVACSARPEPLDELLLLQFGAYEDFEHFCF
jgi:hypothetical protein